MRLTLFAAASAVALMAGSVQAAPLTLDTPASVAQDPTFSDEELGKFGMAMEKLSVVTEQIQNGTPTAEQQVEMAEIVESSGLTVERFNAIGQAVSADPVLQARVALAVAPASPEGSVAASVTDEEVTQFAAASARLAVITESLNGATPTPEQQVEMAAIVENSGLSVERFNAIAQAVGGDDALYARVQLADARREAGTSGGQ